MKRLPSKFAITAKPRRKREQGNARALVFLVAGLAVGFATAAFWYYRSAKAPAAGAPPKSTVTLSEGTKAVLQRLTSPVEIRFYALLGEQNVSDSLRVFAKRADQLLTAFEAAADGKLNVRRQMTLSDEEMRAAGADGIRPFNLDRGDACYLGVVVTQSQQKEVLPQLNLEWEQALEADLARTIAHVTAGQPIAAVTPTTSAAELAAAETVKRTIPNFASVSLEEGKQILREGALKEFQTAAKEMESQIKEAQQHLSQAQSNQSESEQQAARAQLRQVQMQQAEKLKELAAQVDAQITALERLKGVPASSPKR